MSFDVEWDVVKHREEHECDEHWELRRAFMLRWKANYPEERLVCLARVFANMEFMGCRYPSEVMKEVANLSHEVAQDYRKSRKGKLQRTFVSASDAAEDRAKGVRREGGIVQDEPPAKSAKISFVPQGYNINSDAIETSDTEKNDEIVEKTYDEQIDSIDLKVEESKCNDKKSSETVDVNEYLKELERLECIDVRLFNEGMFNTIYGRMVLLIRPWTAKLCNIQISCQVCNVQFSTTYKGGVFTFSINGLPVAEAAGACKAEARSLAEAMAWDKVCKEVISVVVKEQWIAHGEAPISVGDVAGGGRRGEGSAGDFGAPVDTGVAAKMMKLMGWKGGGLGLDEQGIAEPIRPNFQMVKRAGLGSASFTNAAEALMRRYAASDAFDVDLVFSSEFSKEERAQLHRCAQRARLASRSYGADADRFLVVKKKLDPFSMARLAIEKGGETPKYKVFIPAALSRRGRRDR